MTLTPSPELVSLLQRNDKAANRQAFEMFYGKLAGVAQRYAKNQAQADEMLHTGLSNCLHQIQHLRYPIQDLDEFMEKTFIRECVNFIKNIRSEYYVASTVYASEAAPKNYDLFANNELIDFNKVNNEVLIKALQQLVPSQRLIFNLQVIDGYTPGDAAALLESSEQTAKSNLERARFNLQKNIETSLKSLKI